MTQEAVLLTMKTITAKKDGKRYDVCYIYQLDGRSQGQISLVFIPNTGEDYDFDFVSEGGKPCELTVKLQGTRVSYSDIVINM